MRQKCSLVAAVLAAGLIGSVHAQDVRNEGTGDRRSTLDGMIFKPAPMDALLAPSAWIGQKPSAADLSGKVVMVVTWAEWYRPSHSAALLAQRLLDQHGSEGFVVIGVHDQEGFEAATEFASKRKLAFPIVQDEGATIRQKLHTDQDPDIYVIDRAGNMRFADITTETATLAVETLLSEDQQAAVGAMSTLERQRAQQRAQARRSGAINPNVTLENLPVIPFTKPSDETYAATNWPKIDEALLREAQSYAELTPPIAVPDGEWLNGKPSTEGKIQVVYTWHPEDRTVMNDLMLRMEDLHKQRGRDVAVIGLMLPLGDNNRSRDNGGLIVDKTRDVPITMDGMKFALGSKRLTHSLQATQAFAVPQIGRNNRNSNDTIIGTVYIVSTDGRVRRAAHWTQWSKVQQAIDHLLREDPGVAARRQAEDRYIRSNGGG